MTTLVRKCDNLVRICILLLAVMEDMMSNGNPYELVLQDLYAKRDEIDRTIKSLEQLMGGLTAGNEPLSLGIHAEQVFERLLSRVKPGEFHGMSYPSAAKKILSMTDRHALKTEQIIAILERSGRKIESKNPASTVYSSLARNPDFQKVAGNTWGLSEWYEGAARTKKPRKENQVESDEKEPREDKQEQLVDEEQH